MTKAAETMGNNESAAGWTQATLGDFVATRTRGIVPNKTPDTTFELYSVPSLDTGTPEIVTGGEIGSNKQIVDEGTVLLCKINPRINRAWVVSSHTAHQKIASTEWITFPPNESFEPKYLAYYLKQDAVRDFLAVNASGVGGSLMRVKPTTLKDYPFPLAPLDQQIRIVAEIERQFSRLDEAVANLKRVKANLKRYKAVVLKAAVEGRLVETEAEIARREGRNYETGEQLLERILETRRSKWKGKGKYKEPAVPDTTGLPELPEGWVWALIGEAFDVYVGATPSRANANYWNGGVPWVSSGEVAFCRIKTTRETISAKGLENSSTNLHPVGTVLLGMIGEGKTRGQVAILDIKACNNQNSSAIRVSETDVLPEYVYSFLEREYEDTRRRGSGGNQPALNKERVKQIPFPLPPVAEQQRIIDEVERRLSIVGETEAQIDANYLRAGRLRKSILKTSFSGLVSGAIKHDV